MSKDKVNILCKAAVCGFIPILCCVLYCVFQGQSLTGIYLPDTACSDDIFYFKMVEGMVRFGSPLGYFGYNESHAMVSSFGVWSPVLLMPWALWGKVFGWGYFSPILCNICMLSLGFIIFSVLAKPTWKQAGVIALFFFFTTPYTRYMLSGMPETACYSLIIITYGVLYSYFRKDATYKLALLFFLITVLSLMRPYFMVFLLLPGVLWVRRSKLAGCLGTFVAMVLNLAGYKLMTYYFAAPYFQSSMATDFIDSFRNGGFFAGCRFLLRKIGDRWSMIRWNMSLGVREGFTDGQIYFACCIAMLLLFLWLLADFIKMKRHRGNDDTIRNILLESGQLLCFGIMMLAIIVLYQVSEGSRHILVFLIGFILVGAMRDDRSLEKNILTMVVFAYLFVVRYDGDSGYQVPFSDEQAAREVESWSDAFSSCISLDHANAPGFENVVAWVVQDTVDGEVGGVPWRSLFALPEGTGISCCQPQYVTEHIDGLNSRYVITAPGGQIDLLCQEREMELLFRDGSIALYRTY
ncbi:MAG: hypothetical protein NC121_11410 [Blautia sp.]|nr:hypothetical protein [Blautia sp.]